MESWDEFRKICQKPRYKEEGNWMAKNITRDMALPITRVLVFFPITANHVTTLSILVILSSSYFLMKGDVAAILWGAFLFQLWYLLDHVDGQIARYTKTSSITGIFYDFISHHIVNLSILSGLGYGLFRVTGESQYLLAGYLAAVSITLFHAIYESEYKALFGFFQKSARETPTGIQMIKIQTPKTSNRIAETHSLSRHIYSLLHKLCEVHVLMNILTAAAIYCYWVENVTLIRFILIFYGITAPLLLCVKLTYMVKNKAVDKKAMLYIQ
jgi:phosphatidylglycerophosphate synthase